MRKDLITLFFSGALIGFDLITAQHYQDIFRRFSLCLVGVIFLAWQRKWNWTEIGFSASPKQGWKAWGRLGAILGGIVILFATVGHFLMKWLGGDTSLDWTFRSPAEFFSWVLTFAVIIPIQEELLYRTVLCFPFQRIFGTTPTIVFGGVVFALLHFFYGNPSPENFISGFVMTWAYLSSQTIAIPILLHICGNTLAACFHLI